MEPQFWSSRWREKKIGFHRPDPNPALLTHAPALNAFPGKVLVPLAGKSVDMVWLAKQGVEVVGVELVPEAVEAFFREQSLSSRVRSDGPLEIHAAEELPITLIRGDLFDLKPTHVSGVSWVYDRASLVALPADMRARYGAHLQALTAPGTEMLLLTFEYDPERMEGPPFAVLPEEVGRVLPQWHFETLQLQDLPVPDHLLAGGLEQWQQRISRGVRRSAP
jgi:thiopurine S-methyltransferase